MCVVWHRRHGSPGDELIMDEQVDVSGVDALEAACVATPGCAGFNTDGWLKNASCTPTSWTASTCDLVRECAHR